jgi:hypothetical protein
METDEKGNAHCWRHGHTKKAGNSKAGKDIHGLDVEQRRRIEEIKSEVDHPVYDDPLGE